MPTPCPNDEILADYLEGRLSGEERFRVEDHLSACDRCLEAFIVAGTVFRDEDLSGVAPVPAGVTRTAVRLVQRQAAGSCPTLSARLRRSLDRLSDKLSHVLMLKPWTGLQLEPIRGSKTRLAKDLIQLKKQFRDFDAEIEIEKIGEGKAHIRVNFLSGTGDEEKRVRVTLTRGRREVASHLLTRSRVLFENTPFGRYGLVFSRDGVELGEYHFEITENRHGEGQE